ncbi:hypothetical protein C0Q70_09696 [Pomacea canaliculata]|uniref:Sodium/calcium exchanger membrane region domain-containing protein n=1 Tax=Pomacea canaliculata TaxID=400727 RepID=A0A2T7PAI4_POMCA|nr:hypothetical protein C0Q70_09696 [Pomacea canaliculata]
MWRKSSSVIAKLLCMWVFMGAYQFWSRSLSPGIARTKLGDIRHAADDRRRTADLKTLEAEDLNFQVENAGFFKGLDRTYPESRATSRHLLELVNCTPRAVEQFPWDFLTPQQRRNGVIIVHCIIALYMFLALAIVCDRYFVPALEVLCELLHMETDVAGATFMAAGSSAPELATAIIGVFVAKDDVGLGTVVGSAIYNVMFVISMCGLFATSGMKLHWWPMVRDCIAYLLSVVALIAVIADEQIQWYESVILLLMYVLYVVFMYFNERMEVYFVPRCTSCFRRSDSSNLHTETTILYNKVPNNGTQLENGNVFTFCLSTFQGIVSFSSGTFCLLAGWPFVVLLWVLGLPLSALMFLTVPDCRRPSCRKFFWLTFLLSLVWLSLYSFIMVWMITVVGYTFNVPDSVMSLTFIAFGVSLPDVVTSVLVVRDGLGDMAVSNAIGSNVFDILVCLGIPWFLKTCAINPGSRVPVYSEGLMYSSLMLLSTVVFLLVATHLNGWRLTKKYGLLLLVVYVLYTVLASLYELNIFGYFHPSECPSDY